MEQLERISGRFPSVDQSSRFAGVPNLGKPLVTGRFANGRFANVSGQFANISGLFSGKRQISGAVSNPSSETQGQMVGTRESLNGREIFFVLYIFFRPFRLSLAPFICPWVSEDVSNRLPIRLL